MKNEDFQSGPFPFPTDGKRPVILGANGMPVSVATSSVNLALSSGQNSPPAIHPPPGLPHMYDDSSGLAVQNMGFDYSVDPVTGESTG
jgi:hypothetical protein